jgi:hypothetical protein
MPWVGRILSRQDAPQYTGATFGIPDFLFNWTNADQPRRFARGGAQPPAAPRWLHAGFANPGSLAIDQALSQTIILPEQLNEVTIHTKFQRFVRDRAVDNAA